MASRPLWPPVQPDICELSKAMQLAEASGSAASDSGVGGAGGVPGSSVEHLEARSQLRYSRGERKSEPGCKTVRP